jgi:hypothetical protein
MSSNNFEMKFVGNNELLVPVSNDVVELNRFLLDSNAVNTDTNSLDQVPYFGGPVSYAESNNPMPVLSLHSLSKPITVTIPENVAPDGPFILLNKALQEGSRCTGTKPPESNITPDFLLNTQNVIPLSAEYGLPKVPMLQDPYNQLNITGVVNASNPITKLDNTNFTPDMTTSSQFSMMNRQPPPMNPDQDLAMMYATQNARETQSVPPFTSQTIHSQSAMRSSSPMRASPSMYVAPSPSMRSPSPSMRSPSPSMRSPSPSRRSRSPSPSMRSRSPSPSMRSVSPSMRSPSPSMLANPIPAMMQIAKTSANKVLDKTKNYKMNTPQMKKIVMYLSIAILIYVIYLVISRRR